MSVKQEIPKKTPIKVVPDPREEPTKAERKIIGKTGIVDNSYYNVTWDCWYYHIKFDDGKTSVGFIHEAMIERKE